MVMEKQKARQKIKRPGSLLEKGKSKVIERAKPPNNKLSQPGVSLYFDLIQKFPLEPLQGQSHHQKAVDLYWELADESNIDEGRDKYKMVLGLLIKEYENRKYPRKERTPIEVIKALMDENELSQIDMAEYFGSQGRVSDFLNGRRELSKAQIKKLSQRFKLKPEALLS